MPGVRSQQNKENNTPSDEMNARYTAQEKGKAKAQAQAQPMEISDSESDDQDVEMEDVQSTPRPTPKKKRPSMGQNFDPDQGAQEKRDIRQGLRKNIGAIFALRENLAETTTDDIQQAITAGDTLFKRIKAPAEATLDAQFLIMAGQVAAAKARSMRIDKDAFDINDLVARMKTFLASTRARVIDPEEDAESNDDDEDIGIKDKDARRAKAWKKMGILAAKHSLRVPTCDFMLGPLEIEQKQKAQRKKADKKKVVLDGASQNAKRNEGEVAVLNEADIQRDDQETARMANYIHRVLSEGCRDNKIGAMDLFEFVINPTSFAQTIENTFYLSFLIRDGRASLDLDFADFEVTCEPPTQELREEGLKNNELIKRRQIMIELTMETWKDAIELYEITDSYIPTREVQQNPTSGTARWQG